MITGVRSSVSVVCQSKPRRSSLNFTELGAQRGAISINTITILTEFENLNKDFELFLQEVG